MGRGKAVAPRRCGERNENIDKHSHRQLRRAAADEGNVTFGVVTHILAEQQCVWGLGRVGGCVGGANREDVNITAVFQ